MRRPSGFVLFLLLVAILATMCTGVFFLQATRLPDPATADLRGLLRWLVTRDLSREGADVQEKLLERLEHELRQGLELGDAPRQLSDAQRDQLLANADVLGRLWFLKLVDRYSARAISERHRFVNEQLDQQAGIAKALSTLVAETDESARSMWTSLSQRVERWTAPLAPQKKAQAQQFVAAVQGNLVLRTLRATFSESH